MQGKSETETVSEKILLDMATCNHHIFQIFTIVQSSSIIYKLSKTDTW